MVLIHYLILSGTWAFVHSTSEMWNYWLVIHKDVSYHTERRSLSFLHGLGETSLMKIQNIQSKSFGFLIPILEHYPIQYNIAHEFIHLISSSNYDWRMCFHTIDFYLHSPNTDTTIIMYRSISLDLPPSLGFLLPIVLANLWRKQIFEDTNEIELEKIMEKINRYPMRFNKHTMLKKSSAPEANSPVFSPKSSNFFPRSSKPAVAYNDWIRKRIIIVSIWKLNDDNKNY